MPLPGVATCFGASARKSLAARAQPHCLLSVSYILQVRKMKVAFDHLELPGF